MKHYDLVEWKLYKENLLDEDLYKEMEEHLFQCDHCMDIFLSLIDNKEIEEAGEIISNKFTANFMKSIENLSYISKSKNQNKDKKKKQVYNEILLYYTAIASVAIFLTGAGVFNLVVDKMPYISKNVENRRLNIDTNKINEFSNSVLKFTGSFAESFAFKNREEN